METTAPASMNETFKAGSLAEESMSGILTPLWSPISNNFSEFVIIVFGTFIVHELSWLLLNGMYIAIEHYQWFQDYKIQKNKKISEELIWKSFKDLLKGHIIQLLPINIVSYPLFKFFNFYATLPLPSFQTFLIQFLVFNILEDIGFYFVHRLLHTKYMYEKVHYRHHEFVVPFSLTGEIAHPVEFLLNFVAPMMVGPFLMGYLEGVHILTFWTWMVFRETRGCDSHSGYYLPWHPLRILSVIYGGPLLHDFHHSIRGRHYNFGSYIFWDWMMGTLRRPEFHVGKAVSVDKDE